jgi:hypothetical protein
LGLQTPTKGLSPNPHAQSRRKVFPHNQKQEDQLHHELPHGLTHEITHGIAHAIDHGIALGLPTRLLRSTQSNGHLNGKGALKMLLKRH